MKKMNCWEVAKCGRESGGKNVEELGVCPAATDTVSDGLNEGRNAGRICWTVAGTLCGGERQGTFAEKRVSCLSCKFYQAVHKEQGFGNFIMENPNHKKQAAA